MHGYEACQLWHLLHHFLIPDFGLRTYIGKKEGGSVFFQNWKDSRHHVNPQMSRPW